MICSEAISLDLQSALKKSFPLMRYHINLQQMAVKLYSGNKWDEN